MNENVALLAFDLSSVCVGVIACIVNKNTWKPSIVKSCPIIPKKYDVTQLGFMKSKKKLPTKNGDCINTYWKKGETFISKSEKKKRDVLVRTAENKADIEYIGKQISEIISAINPEIIFVEKNEIFNGILTSTLLSKIMGVLLGVAATKNIKVAEIKVKVARSIIDVPKATRELIDSLTEEEILKIPDITKRALRRYMERKYGIYGLKCSTDDESDACVVLNYALENKEQYMILITKK